VSIGRINTFFTQFQPSAMDNLPMKISGLLFVIASVFLTSCNKTPSSHIEEIFNGLRLVHYALEFPRSRESLDKCKKYNNERCLNNFEQAKLAMHQLLNAKHQEALMLTLDTVTEHCGMPEIGIDNLCPGATTALAFFNSENDDKKLLSFLSESTDVALQNIFKMNLEWLYVRKDKSIWSKWVNRSRLNDDTKQMLVNVLWSKNPEHLVTDALHIKDN
jgi:hypothetical protein